MAKMDHVFNKGVKRNGFNSWLPLVRPKCCRVSELLCEIS